jgi:hypothetical protein
MFLLASLYLLLVHPAIISSNSPAYGPVTFHTVLLTPVGLLEAPVSVLPLPMSTPSFSMLSFLFYLEDGGDRFLQSLSSYLSDYTLSYPIKQ